MVRPNLRRSSATATLRLLSVTASGRVAIANTANRCLALTVHTGLPQQRAPFAGQNHECAPAVVLINLSGRKTATNAALQKTTKFFSLATSRSCGVS